MVKRDEADTEIVDKTTKRTQAEIGLAQSQNQQVDEEQPEDAEAIINHAQTAGAGGEYYNQADPAAALNSLWQPPPQAADVWECSTCTHVNLPTAANCANCQTLKGGSPIRVLRFAVGLFHDCKALGYDMFKDDDDDAEGSAGMTGQAAQVAELKADVAEAKTKPEFTDEELVAMISVLELETMEVQSGNAKVEPAAVTKAAQEQRQEKLPADEAVSGTAPAATEAQ